METDSATVAYALLLTVLAGFSTAIGINFLKDLSQISLRWTYCYKLWYSYRTRFRPHVKFLIWSDAFYIL